MRKELKEYIDKPVTLIGRFDRYGRKKDIHDKCSWNTAFLKDLTFENGKPACDHLWFLVQKQFLTTTLKENAVVKISGVVSLYRRKNNSEDLGIKDYIKLEVLHQGDKLVPSKIWKMGKYTYFKFILDSGTRWYKIKDKQVFRVRFVFEYDKFIEEPFIILPRNRESEKLFVEENLMKWLI